MASFIYNTGLYKGLTGAVNFATDTFKVMLTTSAYVADKDLHAFRSSVTNEVTGTGYTAGGVVTAVTVNQDNTNDRIDITFGAVSWPTSTITARYAVYYKSRGGAATADEIIAIDDFGSDVSSTAATFSLAASTLRVAN
jgi:hypothetical protein